MIRVPEQDRGLHFAATSNFGITTLEYKSALCISGRVKELKQVWGKMIKKMPFKENPKNAGVFVIEWTMLRTGTAEYYKLIKEYLGN